MKMSSPFTVVQEIYRFFFFVNKHYPDAERIYIVLDNRDVHFHPDVLEHLTKSCPRIELVRLPTYAPWLNPIEKLWLRLYQKVLDQHDFQNNWEGLKEAVKQWLAQYQNGSQDLLHMVGLHPD
jgi:transposase